MILLMRNFKLLIIAIFVGYFCGYHALEVEDTVPPEIVGANDSIILQANDNYTLLCRGDKPLKWTPEVSNPEGTRIYSTAAEDTSVGRKYALELVITNISYQYVDFYTCSYQDESDLESKVYIFVNDTERLSVTEDQSIMVLVTQFEPAVLPCRPTSPDVEVTLSDVTGSQINNALYDPKTGFTFNITTFDQAGVHFCHFSKELKEEELFIDIHVRSPLNHLDAPILTEKNGGHTLVGETLEIECSIRVPIENIRVTWATPHGPFQATERMNVTRLKRLPGQILAQNLIIKEATLEDRGTYYCNVSDLQDHSSSASLFVYVFEKNEHLPIKLTEDNGLYEIAAEGGQDIVQWIISISGHPAPEVSWRDNNGNPIKEHPDKYEAKQTSKHAILIIKNITIADFGNFTLEAKNEIEKRTLNLFLNVSDKPSPEIQGSPYHIANTEVLLNCSVVGYPQPNIFWQFKPCGKKEKCDIEWEKHGIEEPKDYTHTVSVLKINASKNGYIKCIAKNHLGVRKDGMDFFLTDIPKGRDIFNLPDSIVFVDDNTALVTIGETFTATCGSSLRDYWKPEWTFNGHPLNNINNRHLIENSNTSYSNRSTLTIYNIDKTDQGLYTCMLRKFGDESFKRKNLTLNINVLEPSMPAITNSNMKSEFIETDYPLSLNLYCQFNGLPKPQISWYKDGAPFQPNDIERIIINEKGDNITFLKTDPDIDEGTYTCKVENNLGTAVQQTTLTFKNKKSDPMWYLILTGVLVLIVLILIIFTIIRARKERLMRRRLWEQFKNGNVEAINPELGVNDQAELLPYLKKYEFPKENLKLGKLLGSGAFGSVFKGEAKNIVDTEPITIVAVKTLNTNGEEKDIYFKALVSEMKIMMHMGKHLNVVNLLGACTKNVTKKELLIIVEYCRFGNLQNYLLRHRNKFIDQIDPRTELLDFSIGMEILDRSYSVSSGASSPLIRHGVSSFPDSNSMPPTNMQDYRSATFTGDSADTEMTQVDDTQMLSNNSAQPGWRSNYRGDYNGHVIPICTKDLIIWAFQVSRGMEYLASRKILHSDLAARNILLADNNIVKICDFGLAKSMQSSDVYKKTTNNPMPIKWMALESLEDKDFSTKSDVWSYGIVLWEFFSLGRTPYPGIEVERLYENLKVGYRMECPLYAPKETYKIMKDCWNADPEKRPTFPDLAQRLGLLLNDTLKKYYIDLNDPYLAMNTRHLQDGQTDYLAMLSPQTFEGHTMTPHYVNGNMSPTHRAAVDNGEDSEGYLSMSPNIFSPRVDGGHRVFDFNGANNRKNLNSEEGHPHETLPMLRMISETSCETPNCRSPTAPSSFSNPSYHIPPNVSEKNSKNSTTDTIGAKDNYITMPQYKNIVSNKDLKDTKSDRDNVVLEEENEKVRYVNDFICSPGIQV